MFFLEKKLQLQTANIFNRLQNEVFSKSFQIGVADWLTIAVEGGDKHSSLNFKSQMMWSSQSENDK